MLESNQSAMQGLRDDGRVLRKSAPARALELHRPGKHKAENSMPKLCFGKYCPHSDFPAHFTLNDDFERAIDKPVTN